MRAANFATGGSCIKALTNDYSAPVELPSGLSPMRFRVSDFVGLLQTLFRWAYLYRAQ